MEKMNHNHMIIVFSKETSASKLAKAKEFWKFIDAQSDLQPYKVKGSYLFFLTLYLVTNSFILI